MGASDAECPSPGDTAPAFSLHGAALTLAAPGEPHSAPHLPTETFGGSGCCPHRAVPAVLLQCPFHHGQLSGCRGEAALPGAAEPCADLREIQNSQHLLFIPAGAKSWGYHTQGNLILG